MGRRAEWRHGPRDPKTTLEWLILATSWPTRAFARRWGGLVSDSVERAPFRLASKANRPPRSPAILAVGPLLTLPSPSTPYPCEIEVYRDGRLFLGRDVGVATFFDGWLHYEGYRTSFALRSSDLSRPVRRGTKIELAEGGTVVFRPDAVLIADGVAERDLVRRFARSLGEWSRTKAVEGHSTLPPARAHASGVAHAWLRLVAGVSALALYGLFRGTFWHSQTSLPLVLAVLILASQVRRIRKLSPPCRALLRSI